MIEHSIPASNGHGNGNGSSPVLAIRGIRSKALYVAQLALPSPAFLTARRVVEGRMSYARRWIGLLGHPRGASR
jgi:hypothetical protein